MSARPLPYHLLNAFVSNKSIHSGNQAAVVIWPSSDDPREKDDEYKQLLARDFNFAETAFVVPLDVEKGVWGLRWWTPGTEVPLCGHATLAAASTLFSLHPTAKSLTFQTRWAGDLKADLIAGPSNSNGANTYDVEISLPSLEQTSIQAITDDLQSESARGIVAEWTDITGRDSNDIKGAFKFEWNGEGSVIIELDDTVDLANMPVNPKSLERLGKGLIIVTQIMRTESTETTLRINSRVFVPGVGVDEDPVTGAAHAFLTGYYLASPVKNRLPGKLASVDAGEIEISAQQLSQRGGGMKCRWDNGRAKLVGRAFRWAKGELSPLPEK